MGHMEYNFLLSVYDGWILDALSAPELLPDLIQHSVDDLEYAAETRAEARVDDD